MKIENYIGITTGSYLLMIALIISLGIGVSWIVNNLPECDITKEIALNAYIESFKEGEISKKEFDQGVRQLRFNLCQENKK